MRIRGEGRVMSMPGMRIRMPLLVGVASISLLCGAEAFLGGGSNAGQLFFVERVASRTSSGSCQNRHQSEGERRFSMGLNADIERREISGTSKVYRREFLSGLSIAALGAIGGIPSSAEAFGDYGAHKYEFLYQRATSSPEGDFENPGFGYDACFGLCSDKQLYYPAWMEGEWEVASTFTAKAFPKGEQYVYRNLRAGSARSATEKIGDTTTFAARYLPSKTGGTVLGSIALPSSASGFGAGSAAVTSDRAFNTAEMLNAYAGFARVSRVDYQPDKDPTRMVMQYPQLGADMQPLPPKRTEVFINNRDASLSPDGNSFACSEVFRAVTLGPGQSAIADSENVALFQRQKSPDTILGRQRSIVFLVPSPNSKEGDLYLQVNGRAVAVYDYELRLTRR